MSLKLQAKPLAKLLSKEKGETYDLVIVGGGPAGLTAAVYAGRFQLKYLLIEKMALGGLAATAHSIDNYPGFPEGISGLDLTQKFSEQAKRFGLEILWENCQLVKLKKRGFLLKTDNRSLSCRSLIIAAGTRNSLLDIPGEKEFIGRGVSYCATCDGPFYQGKNVLVIGGGNSAIEEALFLTRYANKVSIVHRRDKLRADKVLAERAMNNPKLYFFWNSSATEIKGDKVVKEVVLKDTHSNKTLTVPADGVFIYVGSRPDSQPVKELVKLDEKGYILADDKLQTSQPGIFAAGDVRAKPLRQVSTAVGDGALAAESARDFLEKS